MHDRRVALVTGANQGIGLQIAKQLVAHGLTVLVGARDLEKGRAAAREIGEGAHAIQIDVTNQASIAAAAGRIRGEFGRLDVLMNNAGISRAQPDQPFDVAIRTNLLTDAPIEDVRTVFETNVIGVVAVTQAMLPLLREAPAGRIVITATSGGSLTLNSDPANSHRRMFGNYSASKAAAHAVMLGFALALEDTNIKVNAACPGFTSTALNNFRGTRSLEEGAREPVRLALIGDDGPTGTFSDENGPVPW
ncbi:SDR family NAD(P)-dependent oxidoreductase [Longimicrobium terrae]|uniref:NAD(P)-dependent dehydrogenase (Short-subunit alcohol dehydrogenase family) n=1 Tax=Longimicrobium terrae TaxID=1639882 RepID=A0A841H1S4_9BACT|nr:SDR family NAD(P)-dependent oxidoreductase [Longimicrobium terrae]MBB4637634.1 NAD(P)-dependent dehydrogenase (short-subunit alcohol dehydrogenase family) [Longimicrobium terrae]MBB6072031.1 NAD(P)-dependent dehydrogenase (short-subunit alcohol dehydrogenase family) [Longimicrobium terrae]NNC29883.1 SDR family NAD(P)-dependent oxidoreductase [Longimicrobium terrae]